MKTSDRLQRCEAAFATASEVRYPQQVLVPAFDVVPLSLVTPPISFGSPAHFANEAGKDAIVSRRKTGVRPRCERYYILNSCSLVYVIFLGKRSWTGSLAPEFAL
jgi:hypothetical protein